MLIGIVAGLLLATTSGEDLRRQISIILEQIVRRARQQAYQGAE
jgi:hypothetical protein